MSINFRLVLILSACVGFCDCFWKFWVEREKKIKRIHVQIDFWGFLWDQWSVLSFVWLISNVYIVVASKGRRQSDSRMMILGDAPSGTTRPWPYWMIPYVFKWVVVCVNPFHPSCHFVMQSRALKYTPKFLQNPSPPLIYISQRTRTTLFRK